MSSEQAKEYSVEWFRELYEYHDEWLGEQARQLWEHYEELEQENEQLWRVARRHTCVCTCIDLDVQHHDETCYYRLFAKEVAEIIQREREAQEWDLDYQAGELGEQHASNGD